MLIFTLYAYVQLGFTFGCIGLYRRFRAVLLENLLLVLLVHVTDMSCCYILVLHVYSTHQVFGLITLISIVLNRGFFILRFTSSKL